MFLFFLTYLALLAAVVFAQGNTVTNLEPIVAGPPPNARIADPLIPSTHITLNYGLDGVSLVNVSLAMNYPAVLLEEVNAVVNVACTASSVTVTFADTQTFDKTVAEWNGLDDFVLITNHLGACDVEYERGMFLVDFVAWDNAALTVTANAHKEEVAQVAGKTKSHKLRAGAYLYLDN
jgi:hypothetical protein